MKQVIITPDNLPEQKLSDVMESCITDVDSALKRGIKIDMGRWIDYNRHGNICCVCLGGAALLGFGFKCVSDIEGDYRVLQLRHMLDRFRLKDKYSFYSSTRNLFHLNLPMQVLDWFPDNSVPYRGQLNKKEIDRLRREILDFVDLLRKHKL
jgi:hypothetical protein